MKVIDSDEAENDYSDIGRRGMLKSTLASLAGISLSGCISDSGEQSTPTENPNCPDRNLRYAASISFEYNESSEELTMTHDGGHGLPVDRVYIHGEGISPEGSWRSISNSDISGDEIVAGMSVTVNATPDYRVYLENGQMEKCQDLIYVQDQGPEA